MRDESDLIYSVLAVLVIDFRRVFITARWKTFRYYEREINPIFLTTLQFHFGNICM